MKKAVWIVALGFICLHLAGCSGWLVRTSESRQPRVDQEVAGNRGFILGKPATAAPEPAFKDRKVYKIEVEIPQWGRKKKSVSAQDQSAVDMPSEDKVLWGNRGYLTGGPKTEVTPPEAAESPMAVIKEKISQIFKSEPEQREELPTYQVQKGDTLQKISRRFYGTTKKWPLLYKTNRDKLKGPDELHPGMVLVIPEVDQYKK